MSINQVFKFDQIITAILVLLLAGVDSSSQSQIDHDDLYHQYGRIISQEPRNVDLHTHLVYKPLCNYIEKRVELADDDFDYQPSHYIEITCTKTGAGQRDLTQEENRQMCNIPGFDCIQQHKKMTFLRRRKGFESNGWEPFSQDVPSHCECLWPKIE